MDSINQGQGHDTALQKLQALEKEHAAVLEDQLTGQLLQQQLRPSSPWQTQGVTFEHYVLPALYLTGDALDYCTLPDGRLFLYLADVSGSGTAAALISVLLKSIVQDFIFTAEAERHATPFTPAQLLTHLNQRLLAYKVDRHVTLVCATLDTEQELLQWSMAGHLPSPILYSNGQATFLSGKGLPVGLFAHATYDNEQMALPATFSLSLLSDGVFDVLPQDSLVGSESALPALVNAAQGEFTQIVQRLGLANCSNMPDDIALLVLSRNFA